MTTKPRRIDFSADNLIAGVSGQLDLEEFAVYWMVCTLIYSRGGPIPNDPSWIAGIFRATNPRTIRAALERLEARSKIERTESELMVNRCRTELEAASKRIRTYTENGSNGGRPVNGNRHLDKPSGSTAQNLPAPSPSLPPSPSIPKKESHPSGEPNPQLVADCWNAMAKANNLPEVHKLTDARKRLAAARLRDAGGAEGIHAAVAKVAASPWLKGLRNGAGHENWRCTFDYLISERGFTKIMEGNYDERGNGAQPRMTL